MQRRDFLKGMLAAGALVVAGQCSTAPPRLDALPDDGQGVEYIFARSTPEQSALAGWSDTMPSCPVGHCVYRLSATSVHKSHRGGHIMTSTTYWFRGQWIHEKPPGSPSHRKVAKAAGHPVVRIEAMEVLRNA